MFTFIEPLGGEEKNTQSIRPLRRKHLHSLSSLSVCSVCLTKILHFPALEQVPRLWKNVESDVHQYFLVNYSFLNVPGPPLGFSQGVKCGIFLIHRTSKHDFFVTIDITLLCSLSLLFMPCCLLFIYSSLGFCCVFVSFLVVSGKLKCHPSPIHRPDRDRKLSQPPSPSTSHHFSTLQSALMFLLSRATVTKGH